MGIIGNIRDKLSSKVHEMHERRETDRKEFDEHYNKEFEAARKREVKAAAEKKAREDAYARVHPVESAASRLGRITDSLGDLNKRTGSSYRAKEPKGQRGSNSLGKRLEPLGDVGRSIGKQFHEMDRPSWMKDFDDPTKLKKPRP